MVVIPSALRLATFCSIVALLLGTAQAHAQSAGGGGTGGATTSGGGTGGGGTVTGGAGGQSGGTAAAGMSSSAGAAAGGAASVSSNLVTNGTFDTVKDPWWGYATTSTESPADQTLAVTDGKLCATMTAAGKNVWDVGIGLSPVALLKNQYYHIRFSVSADANRTIKFKTGFGE